MLSPLPSASRHAYAPLVLFLIGLLLAVFVLPSPWGLVAVVVGGVLDLAETSFFFWWSKGGERLWASSRSSGGPGSRPPTSGPRGRCGSQGRRGGRAVTGGATWARRWSSGRSKG